MHKCRFCEQFLFTRTQLSKHIAENHGSPIDVKTHEKVDATKKTFEVPVSSLWETSSEAVTSDVTGRQANDCMGQTAEAYELNNISEKKSFSSQKFCGSHVKFVLKNLEHLWPPGGNGHGLSRQAAQEVGKLWLTKLCFLLKGKNYRSSKHSKVDFMGLLNEAFHVDPFLSRPTLKELQQETGLSRLGITLWFKWSREKLQYISPKQIMLSTFNKNQYPGPELVAKLEKSTGLSKSKIESWFRVSRALSNIFDPKLADKEEMILWRMFKRKIKGISDEDVDLMAELLQMEKAHVYKIFLTWCQRYEVDNFMTPALESSQRPNINLSSTLFLNCCTDDFFKQTCKGNDSITYNHNSVIRTPIIPSQFCSSFTSSSEESIEANNIEDEFSSRSELGAMKHNCKPTFSRAFDERFPCSKSSHYDISSVCSPRIDNENQAAATSSRIITNKENDGYLPTEDENDDFLSEEENNDLGENCCNLPEEKEEPNIRLLEEEEEGPNIRSPEEKEEPNIRLSEEKEEPNIRLSEEEEPNVRPPEEEPNIRLSEEEEPNIRSPEEEPNIRLSEEKKGDGNFPDKNNFACSSKLEDSGILFNEKNNSNNLSKEERIIHNLSTDEEYGSFPAEKMDFGKIPAEEESSGKLCIVETDVEGINNLPKKADCEILPSKDGNTFHLPALDYNKYPLVIVEKIEDFTHNNTLTTGFPTACNSYQKHPATTSTSVQTFVKALENVFEANVDGPRKPSSHGLLDQLSDHQLVLNVLKKLRRKQLKRGIPCRVKVANVNIEKGKLYTASYRRKTRDLKRIKNRCFPSYLPRRSVRTVKDMDVEHEDAHKMKKNPTQASDVAVLNVLYKDQQNQRYLQLTKPWQRGNTKRVESPTDAENALYNAVQDHPTSSDESVICDSTPDRNDVSFGKDEDCLYIVEDVNNEMSCDYLQRSTCP